MLDFQCFKWLYDFTVLSLDKQKYDKPKADVGNILYGIFLLAVLPLSPKFAWFLYICIEYKFYKFVGMILSDLLIKF